MAGPETDIRYIKGVGERRAASLKKLGITTLRELVCYFPRAYEDRTDFSTIAGALPEENVCIRAMVADTPRLSQLRGGRKLVKLRVVDDTGSMDVTFFNNPYVRDKLIKGQSYIFYGKVGGVPFFKSMINPQFEPDSGQNSITGRILPVYRLAAGLSQKLLRDAVKSGLETCGDAVPDALPESVRERYGLAQARYAYENIHAPADHDALAAARRRLVFEELFVLACALSGMRHRRREAAGQRFDYFDPEEFYAALPFSPTSAQRRSFDEASSDMCSGELMNRLLQGDVGSGKTLVAAACIWLAQKNGCQSAFMAPTEILAEQHFRTLSELLKPFGTRVELLTGSISAARRRALLMCVASGDIDLVIGTHAILTQDVEFCSLGLVIADEQHRFGVNQRAALSAKGKAPHALIMSATPIPRTLALMIYGDLDVSVLDELPPGRQRVDTFSVNEDYRERLNGFISKLVGEGRQVFVVCPMIEESELLPENVKNAQEHAAYLTETFTELRVACIHGRLRAKQKDELMNDFALGKYDILVSTTVIEVGVDVPNAALMIVENAERFGLSQLHQLRGRVGRGQYKSYCVLVCGSESDEIKARLRVMCKTNDGFKISEEDLRLRGPGDFFGSRQHGLPDMHVADLMADVNVLKTARDAASELLSLDPGLDQPENSALKARIGELFDMNAGRSN